MQREISIPDVSRFDAVDQTEDPAAIVEFLDAAAAIPDLQDLKVAMLERSPLGRAHAALDVGYGSVPMWPRWTGGCRRMAEQLVSTRVKP